MESKIVDFFFKHTDSGLDSQVALVNSHDYMTLLGHTAIAWTWLRVAVSAAQVLCVGVGVCWECVGVCWYVLQCAVVCCSVCCSVLQYDAAGAYHLIAWTILRVAGAVIQVLCVAVYWSMLECVGCVFECLFECVEVCCTYTHTRG